MFTVSGRGAVDGVTTLVLCPGDAAPGAASTKPVGAAPLGADAGDGHKGQVSPYMLWSYT